MLLPYRNTGLERSLVQGAVKTAKWLVFLGGGSGSTMLEVLNFESQGREAEWCHRVTQSVLSTGGLGIRYC